MNENEQGGYGGMLMLFGVVFLGIVLCKEQWNWWIAVAILIMSAGGILFWREKTVERAEESTKEKWKENGVVKK